MAVGTPFHARTAPLCTSANLSGDPRGTITDEARAAAFARDRGVRLWIRAPRDVDARGSYPVFSLSNEGFTVERDGPGAKLTRPEVAEIVVALDAALAAGEAAV